MLIRFGACAVFEDDERVRKTVEAVENEIHHDSSISDEKAKELA